MPVPCLQESKGAQQSLLWHHVICYLHLTGQLLSMKRDTPSAPSQPINLHERIVKLTAKRQEVLRPVLEHPRGFVLLSVRAMAKRLNTDPATIVRIVRVLGFSISVTFRSTCTISPSPSRLLPIRCRPALPAAMAVIPMSP